MNPLAVELVNLFAGLYNLQYLERLILNKCVPPFLM